MDAVAKALDSFLDQKVEARAILIIKENGLAAIAAQDDVIERPGIVNSWLTSHGAILHNKLQLCKPDPTKPPLVSEASTYKSPDLLIKTDECLKSGNLITESHCYLTIYSTDT
jgi:hypothetical protein